jgi:hypothetical protein
MHPSTRATVTALAAMLLLWAAPQAAVATALNVRVEAPDGAAEVTVEPGDPVPYRLVGELSDSATRGLALFVLDLELPGGTLGPMTPPGGMPLANFVPPAGFSHNPEGFGGTTRGAVLLQVGGAQNVFAHGQWACKDDLECPGDSVCAMGTCSPLPDLPAATLIPDVAQPGAPEVLATGVATAPTAEGTYTLGVTRLAANLVQVETDGDPFWATEPATVGQLGALTIRVEDQQPPPGQDAYAIPTLTEWGLALLVVLLAAAAVLLLRGRVG